MPQQHRVGQSPQQTSGRFLKLLAVRALGLLLLLGALGTLGACERIRQWGAPAGTSGSSGNGTAPAVRPFPELPQVAAVVAEARAILPRVPAEARPPALAAPEPAPQPAPRLALAGEGILLRPSAFPALPQRLRVELWLDERDPPGGYLLVSDAQGNARWPILDAYATGRREAAFAVTFRLSDPAARLRYLALLGVPYEAGGQRFRSFEGYLIHPAPGGAVSAQGAIYPIDFGYRQPEPPEPVVRARALEPALAALRAQLSEWQALGVRVAELQDAARRLREAQVPAEQAARQRQDLADFAARVATGEVERKRAAAALRERLLAAYAGRAGLADAWNAFTESNAYRWRTAPERRAVYQPLQALRSAYPALEQAYEALGGAGDAALKSARAAMEQALLREQEQAPGG